MKFNKNLRFKILNIASVILFSFSGAAAASAVHAVPARDTAKIGQSAGVGAAYSDSENAHSNNNAENEAESIKAAILNWREIPGAVRYELRIKDAETKKTVFAKYDIYAAGCQIDSSEVDFSKKLIWQVRGLNYDKVPISDYTKLRWLKKGRVFDDESDISSAEPNLSEGAPEAPVFSKTECRTYIVKNTTAVNPLKLTAQFGEMAYMPVYPVYSWVPVKNAAYYIIDVFKAEKDGAKKIESLKAPQGMDYYDTAAYTKEGEYYFNVQAYDAAKHKIAQSENSFFTVVGKADIAALGDSITHGGGAISTPPSAVLYNWETYADLPVLNIGFSGNLTSSMLSRFDKDVAPFSPKLLIIMGGVNDIRTGVKADTVIHNLQAIKDKCLKQNIVPVFLTVTPINPPKMTNIGKIEAPSPHWQQERNKINDWIKTQDYYADPAADMTDERGYLKDELTTDGLHPDYEGKKHIGQTVGDYLRMYFPHLI